MPPTHQQQRVLAIALSTALLPSLRGQDPSALDSVRSGAAVLRRETDQTQTNNWAGVKELQTRLQAFLRASGSSDLAERMKPDGKFGPLTERAVELFQLHIIATPELQRVYAKAAGKPLIHPDTIVGKGTVAALDAWATPQSQRPPHALFLQSIDTETRQHLSAKLRSSMPTLSTEEAVRRLSNSMGIDWSSRQISKLQSLCKLPVTGTLDKGTCSILAHIVTAEWYKATVGEAGTHYQWNSSPGSVNVVGLRGYDLSSGKHRNPFNQWNDTIAIIRYDERGVPSVTELRGTTDPGKKESSSSPDVNRDGIGDVAHLVPGQYQFRVGPHKGQFGALVPTEDLPVHRDTNHNGSIEGIERERTLTATGIHIHWTSTENPTKVGGESLGCQVPALESPEFKKAFTQGITGPVLYTLVDLSIK